jgi:hypothetical protein
MSVADMFENITQWLRDMDIVHDGPASQISINGRVFDVRRVGEIGYVWENGLKADAEILAGLMLHKAGVL